MIRIRHTSLTIAMLAIFATFGEVQAQVFNRSSASARFVPQNRATFGTQSSVYANNSVQSQSYRPSYGKTAAYSNGNLSVQSNGTYIRRAPPKNSNPTDPYYSNDPPIYSSYQAYSRQLSTVHSSKHGSGYYTRPQ